MQLQRLGTYKRGRDSEKSCSLSRNRILSCSWKVTLFFTTFFNRLDEAHPHCFSKSINLFYFIWPCPETCRILVPQPGIKPVSLEVATQSPNHWTARKFPKSISLNVNLIQKHFHRGTSLVVPWLKICPAVQRMWVLSLVRTPHASGQLSLWAATTEP